MGYDESELEIFGAFLVLMSYLWFKYSSRLKLIQVGPWARSWEDGEQDPVPRNVGLSGFQTLVPAGN